MLYVGSSITEKKGSEKIDGRGESSIYVLTKKQYSNGHHISTISFK
jgi:hypothetical protein